MAHLDDEILSAVRDGEQAAPDHLASCADCRSRLEELDRVAAFVAAPPEPPSSGHRDTHVAAALAAWDQRAVTPLRPRSRPPAWLGAAAAVLIVGAGVALLVNSLGGSSRVVHEAAVNAPTTAAGGRVALSDGARGVAPVAAPGEDFGSQNNVDIVMAQVRDRLSSSLASSPSAAALGPAQPTDCPASGPGRLVLRGTVDFDGNAAQVLAYQVGPPAGIRIDIKAAAGCSLLASRTT